MLLLSLFFLPQLNSPLFQSYQLPDNALVFQPPRNKTEVLKPVNFLGKAKVSGTHTLPLVVVVVVAVVVVVVVVVVYYLSWCSHCQSGMN